MVTALNSISKVLELIVRQEILDPSMAINGDTGMLHTQIFKQAMKERDMINFNGLLMKLKGIHQVVD